MLNLNLHFKNINKVQIYNKNQNIYSFSKLNLKNEMRIFCLSKVLTVKISNIYTRQLRRYL